MDEQRLTPDADQVADRAHDLTSAERRAGVDDPKALAEEVLAESEDRVWDREAAPGTVVEHRRSDDSSVES